MYKFSLFGIFEVSYVVILLLYNPPHPPQKVLSSLYGDANIAATMNPFQSEEDVKRNEIESWKTFAYCMNNECEKKEFGDMVNNYYTVSILGITYVFVNFDDS